MSATPQHPYDQAADAVASYIDRMSDELVKAVMENGKAPFSTTMTRAQQEQYYAEKYGHLVYHTDGTANEQGREKLFQWFGADAAAEIMRVCYRARGVIPMLPPDSPPMSYPPGDNTPPVLPEPDPADQSAGGPPPPPGGPPGA